MRFHELLLGSLSVFLFSSPAEAGRLLSWRFESNQNRLFLTTEEEIQPRAQLISNPSRVIIDLPGTTLARSSVKQAVGGYVSSLRVGQFDAQTTRLVIELAPEYTLDPQQVRIKALSPTQWTVDLPTPQPLTPTLPLPPTPSETSQRATQPPSSFTTPSITTSKQSQSTTDFQITRNGLFIRLNSDGDNSKIKVQRSRDRKTIEFTLEDATLPSSLVSQSLPVNSYGIRDIQFAQTSLSDAQITLNVGEYSPDWQAIYSRFGGLVLLSKGGVSSLEGGNRISKLPSEEENQNNESNSDIVIIESLELDSDNTQLLIKGDRIGNASGNWNSREGVYEIRIPNAKLSDSFPELQLDRNSPIYEVKLREEDNQTVVILIKPSLGVQFGNLNRSDDQVFALEIQSSNNQETALSPIPIYVPPPETSTPSTPPETLPSSPIPNVPQGKVTVIIDPGHGGQDPGAIGLSGLQEKEVILSISHEVAQLLKQQGVQVMMTRDSDYFVSLQGRTDLANRAGVDLFVSIHANSMGQGRPDVSGLEVYYYGNQALASTIQKSILRTVNIKDRGVRRARFYVLRKSAMPATLVEVGFVTGSQDAANLKNPTYRRQMAMAIARGTLEYIQQNKL